MVLTSVVIYVEPAQMEAAVEAIRAVEEVTVHDVLEGYKVVALAEADDVQKAHEIIGQSLPSLPGVLGVYLVEAHYDA